MDGTAGIDESSSCKHASHTVSEHRVPRRTLSSLTPYTLSSPQRGNANSLIILMTVREAAGKKKTTYHEPSPLDLFRVAPLNSPTTFAYSISNNVTIFLFFFSRYRYSISFFFLSFFLYFSIKLNIGRYITEHEDDSQWKSSFLITSASEYLIVTRLDHDRAS